MQISKFICVKSKTHKVYISKYVAELFCRPVGIFIIMTSACVDTVLASARLYE